MKPKLLEIETTNPYITRTTTFTLSWHVFSNDDKCFKPLVSWCVWSQTIMKFLPRPWRYWCGWVLIPLFKPCLAQTRVFPLLFGVVSTFISCFASKALKWEATPLGLNLPLQTCWQDWFQLIRCSLPSPPHTKSLIVLPIKFKMWTRMSMVLNRHDG